jgi:hypothetical protein
VQDDWVTDVLGSEGIIGGAYELPPMEERIGGAYELPEIGGCPPPRRVAMAGAPLYIRHGEVEYRHQRPKARRKLRTNLEAISGAMYELECAGYEAAAGEQEGVLNRATRPPAATAARPDGWGWRGCRGSFRSVPRGSRR